MAYPDAQRAHVELIARVQRSALRQRQSAPLEEHLPAGFHALQGHLARRQDAIPQASYTHSSHSAPPFILFSCLQGSSTWSYFSSTEGAGLAAGSEAAQLMSTASAYGRKASP